MVIKQPATTSQPSTVSAAMAVVVGLQLRQPPTSATPAAVVAATSDDSLDTVLDENPDFYLWLASRDATAIAME